LSVRDESLSRGNPVKSYETFLVHIIPPSHVIHEIRIQKTCEELMNEL